MEQERRDLIDMVADAVRRIYDIGSPVGNIQEVVEKMGGKIKTDFSVHDGRIVKDGDNSFTVSISTEEKYFDSKYNRSIIAHELGHLFLHMYYQFDTEKWNHIQNGQSFNRHGYSEKEADAYEFERAFLMPKNEYYRIVKKLVTEKEGKKYVDTSAIASHFKVSELEAINRGILLGIFKYKMIYRE